MNESGKSHANNIISKIFYITLSLERNIIIPVTKKSEMLELI